MQQKIQRERQRLKAYCSLLVVRTVCDLLRTELKERKQEGLDPIKEEFVGSDLAGHDDEDFDGSGDETIFGMRRRPMHYPRNGQAVCGGQGSPSDEQQAKEVLYSFLVDLSHVAQLDGAFSEYSETWKTLSRTIKTKADLEKFQQ